MPASQAASLTPETTGTSGRCAGAKGDGRTVDLAMALLRHLTDLLPHHVAEGDRGSQVRSGGRSTRILPNCHVVVEQRQSQMAGGHPSLTTMVPVLISAGARRDRPVAGVSSLV